MENEKKTVLTDKKIVMSFTLSNDVKKKLEKLSKKLGINRSALISLAVNEMFEKNK